MNYTLDDFCADIRAILKADETEVGKEQIRKKLEVLLGNPEFCAAYVSPDDKSGMTQIYQDATCGFCVLAYNMRTARTSPPHDHGRSWAVYGQAVGHTDMTIWETASEGNIMPVRTFRLEPGQAGLFDVHAIHSIDYPAGSKFVRVTGVDMSKETRRVFDPATGAVRELAQVGTGNAG